MSKPTRRDFIKTGAGAAGAGLMLPIFNARAAGTTVVKQLAENQIGDGKVLVIVELAGGCDALNTIVPLRQYDIYASFRSRVKIPKEQILRLYGSTTMGLAPQLSAIKPLADAGKLAVIQSAHYPVPNFSHDDSRNYYRIATDTSRANEPGWIGRHAELFGNFDNALDTVGIGEVNRTLYAAHTAAASLNVDANGNPVGHSFLWDDRALTDRQNQISVLKINSTPESTYPYDAIAGATTFNALASSDAVAQAVATYNSQILYPAGDEFASGLKMIAKLITAKPSLGSRVFYISDGGYDTHGNQNIELSALLKHVAAGLKAFYDDLVAHNMANEVLILVWSEFSRRVADNASGGTDHGAATNLYVLGGAVKGGTYGPDPNLTDLAIGNLKTKVDFRSVYAEIISKWLGGDPAVVLNGNFPQLGFL